MLEILLSALSQLTYFLSYVAGRSTFPQPLSSRQEEEQLKKMKAGDQAARATLIEHNLRLVAHIAKKYASSPIDSDDLISIGTIGLIKAVSTYKTDSGTLLATYAARCIENEILMAIRSSRKQRNEVSLQEPVGVDKEGNEISLLDVLGSEPDLVEGEVVKRVSVGRVLLLIKSELTPRERVVLQLRYGLSGRRPYAQREVAQVLGISRSYVSRLEKKAVQKLEAAMRKT